MTRTFLALIEIFALLLVSVDGTHFLGGTISWRPLNPSDTGSPVAIVITQTYSWTWSIAQCTSNNIANSDPVPFSQNFQGINNKLSCVLNCGTATGYVAPGIWPYCTDVSSAQGTTVGQRSDTVYVLRNADFTVAFASNAWRSLATNAAASWSLASRIKLTPRSDNGLYNTAPVATVMSPIYIPQNQPTVINVPIADADGDPIRCRWSNGTTECGDVCPPNSLPSGTLIFPNCTIIITGTHVGDWFAVTVQVEDFIDSTSTTPLSSVPVQFLVQVVAPPSCAIAPEVYELSQRSCIPVTVAQTFTSQLIAINHCGSNVTIVDIATLSFAGMVQSSIIKLNSTTYYKTLTWTPTIAQLGFQVMCAMAVDNQNSQSSQYCFKFYVSQNGVSSCPGDPTVTSTTTTTVTTTSVTTTTATTSTTNTTSTTTSTTSISTTSTTSTTSATSTTSTTSTSTTSTTSTSTSTTSATKTTKKPDPINWPLIGSIISLFLLSSLVLCCCLCWRYFSLPASWGISEENGPFELYHIERCTDPDCQWSSVSNSPVNSQPMKHKNYLISKFSNESAKIFTIDGISSSNSNEDENNLAMINFYNNDHHIQLKSVDSDNVSVKKIRRVKKIHSAVNSAIKSSNRKNDEDDNLSNQRLNSSGTVRVTRIKSSIKKKPIIEDNKSGHQEEENFHTEPLNIIRVTHVPSVPLSSTDICRPSIIENTIRLDENDETSRSSIRSSKKNKDKVHVKRMISSHRTSAIEHRPSQIDTIELPLSTNESVSQGSPSSVRVEHVRTGKKKLKSIRSIVLIEPISEEILANEKNEQEKSDMEFGVTVERISREKSTKSIK